MTEADWKHLAEVRAYWRSRRGHRASETVGETVGDDPPEMSEETERALIQCWEKRAGKIPTVPAGTPDNVTKP